MPQPIVDAEMIRKEDIPSLVFNKEEVLQSLEQMNHRMSNLQRGMRGGNANKHKVNVYFFDASGKEYRVETTIWAVTAQRVVFKHGTTVPVCRVSHVSL